MYEIIAPHVGGATLDDGRKTKAKLKINGGPSDFVRDAVGRCRFLAYTQAALPLFKKGGIADDLAEGCFQVMGNDDLKSFLSACRELRFWAREMDVDLDADALR